MLSQAFARQHDNVHMFMPCVRFVTHKKRLKPCSQPRISAGTGQGVKTPVGVDGAGSLRCFWMSVDRKRKSGSRNCLIFREAGILALFRSTAKFPSLMVWEPMNYLIPSASLRENYMLSQAFPDNHTFMPRARSLTYTKNKQKYWKQRRFSAGTGKGIRSPVGVDGAGSLRCSQMCMDRRQKAGSHKLRALSGSSYCGAFPWHPGLARLIGMH